MGGSRKADDMFSVESSFIDDKAVAPARPRLLQPTSVAATLLIATVFITSAVFAGMYGHSNEEREPLKNPPIARDVEEAPQAFAWSAP